MGLLLCRWLCDNSAVRKTASSSSPFLPLAVAPPTRLSILLDAAPVSLDDPRSHWSPTEASPNLRMVGGACVCRDQVEQSSDAVRAAHGIKAGLHVWEVLWEPGQRGSHALIGISTNKGPRQASGYKALVGGDSCSWGWELSTNQLWHSGKEVGPYPTGPGRPLEVPGHVLVVVDADAGTLGYAVDEFYLGVAFEGLPKGVELFPTISCVWGGARIYLRYINGASRDPPALACLCRLGVRQALGRDREALTDRLPLPPILQRLLLPKS
ncbi:LOW QUALITY PROTEIN: SPRY domain-containing SOCS box protein 2-like [Denticeps clupeoides]|uniref:LOW QUALITY PROTEIN: SPRY domain-containing SOCS box protein 2-like n=1 Tax=Denticeps clupeoides TaxID=299321 RepID=UPI0010A4DBF3|nr:LOW QUALITY PROTEIN: SPRY domain-containing SOCS box protein 2-like [Denticeps clupeoides]